MLDRRDAMDGLVVTRIHVSGSAEVVEELGVVLDIDPSGTYVLAPCSDDERPEASVSGALKLLVTREVGAIEQGDVVTGTVARAGGAVMVSRTLARGSGVLVLTVRRALGIVHRSDIGADSLAVSLDADNVGTVLVFAVDRDRLTTLELDGTTARLGGECTLQVTPEQGSASALTSLKHFVAQSTAGSVQLRKVSTDVPTCRGCGTGLTEGQRFCRGCGAAVQADHARSVPVLPACAGCGAVHAAGQRFCRSCGASLVPSDDAPTQTVKGAGIAASPAATVVLSEPPAARQPIARAGVARPPLPPPAPQAPDRSGGSRRPWIIAVVAILVLVAGGGGVWVLLSASDEPVSQELSQSGASDPAQVPAADAASETDSFFRDRSGGEASVAGSPGADATQAGLPDVSEQQMESDIQQMLQTWHQNLADGSFREAWERLSDRKRSQNLREMSYDRWVEGQSTLGESIDPSGLETTLLSTDARTGVAMVRISGMAYSGRGSCSEWSGITWARYETGEWRYDPGFSTTPQRRRAYKDRFSELLGGSC